MINIPEAKIGVVAVSRDCFPESLSVNRRTALIDGCDTAETYGEVNIFMSARSVSWRVRSIWYRHWRM